MIFKICRPDFVEFKDSQTINWELSNNVSFTTPNGKGLLNLTGKRL